MKYWHNGGKENLLEYRFIAGDAIKVLLLKKYKPSAAGTLISKTERKKMNLRKEYFGFFSWESILYEWDRNNSNFVIIHQASFKTRPYFVFISNIAMEMACKAGAELLPLRTMKATNGKIETVLFTGQTFAQRYVGNFMSLPAVKKYLKSLQKRVIAGKTLANRKIQRGIETEIFF